MTEQPLTCIIIPVYNRRNLTLQCLERLQWCAGLGDWCIVLVDDGSTDGTADEVRARHPHVEIVQGSGDLYWTGAIRLGMQRALNLGADVMMWLNDDTRPDEASLRRMSGIVRAQPDMVLAPRVIVGDERINCNSLGRKPAPVTGEELDVADMLAGFQVALSRSVVEEIGLPDDRRWPHYAGDGSYTHTAHKHGFRIRVDSRSEIRLSGFEPYLSIEDMFWSGTKALSQRITSCFFAKKSKFRLSTQWHFDVLHRGFGGACVVFPARLTLWLLKIVRHRMAWGGR